MKTRSFKNLSEFTAFLEEVNTKYKIIETAALEYAGKTLKDDAKRKLGVYQHAEGPYEEWEQLSPATQEDRVRKGFSPNDPLYRTGELMNSIDYMVVPGHMVMGSTSEIMVWQEKGVEENNLPPRPVIGPAMYEGQLMLRQVIWELLRCWLLNEKPHFSKSIFFPIK